MTVRFRPDVARAIKQTVFELKMTGTKPDPLQDVLNEALRIGIQNAATKKRRGLGTVVQRPLPDSHVSAYN